MSKKRNVGISKESGDNLFTDENGELRVDGTVFLGSIQLYASKNLDEYGNPKRLSNVVDAVGYKITNVKTNEWFFMEKMEAIDLVRKLGVVNASVRTRRQLEKDENGNVVAEKIHLNLQPLRNERPFTSADRLYPIFKIDKNGKIIQPVEVNIKEEHCTKLMWELIENAYSTRRGRGRGRKANNLISTEEKLARIEEAMAAANFQGADNPFSK